MPLLMVMRHAKSDWISAADYDFDRPLSARGHRAAQRMTEWLSENDLIPDKVISSSALRTRETVGYVVDGLALASEIANFDDSFYLAGPSHWLDTIQDQTDEKVLICGHNPGLEYLVYGLAPKRPPLTDSGKLMTTAAIAVFAFDCPWAEVEFGSGRLVHLARPNEL